MYFLFVRSTAESLSSQTEAELQRRLEERQQEISHMQEVLETKVQLLQEVWTTHAQRILPQSATWFSVDCFLCGAFRRPRWREPRPSTWPRWRIQGLIAALLWRESWWRRRRTAQVPEGRSLSLRQATKTGDFYFTFTYTIKVH